MVSTDRRATAVEALRTDLAEESLGDHGLAVGREGDDGLRGTGQEDGEGVLLLGKGEGDLLTGLESTGRGEGEDGERNNWECGVVGGALGDKLREDIG